MKVECLIGPMSSRGRAMMTALLGSASRAGVDVERTDGYRGNRDLLLTYGLGDASRFEAWKRHRAAGGRSIIFDCGYWARKGSRKAESLQRCAIDGLHCDAMVYAAPPRPDRLRQYGAAAKDHYNPDGPIIIVGMGKKGALNAGVGLGQWEQKALAIARERWPDKRVWYRPKVRREGYPPLPGADAVKDEPNIYSVINGASLVMCQHSNVGVDAIVSGVPVLAEAGAACALHGYGLDAEPEVKSAAERQRFLEHLAAWQWTPNEAAAGMVWPFLLEMLAWTQDRSTNVSGSNLSHTPPMPEAAE